MKIKISKSQWDKIGENKLKKQAQGRMDRNEIEQYPTTGKESKIRENEFVLNFNIENEIFGDDPIPEIIRILEDVKNKVKSGQTSSSILDANGNKIGLFEIY